MTRITLLPKDDRVNGWSALLPSRQPRPPLTGDISADVVVIGAGFAGIGAARRLGELRPNAKIVVFDAQQLGENASGRNSGFAIDLPHNVGSSLEELAKGNAYMRLARAGISSLRDCVERYGIDCDWSEDGKYHTATSERGGEEVLRPTIKELDRLNEPYEWLGREETAKRLGTRHFAASVYTRGTVLLNPAALNRGLGENLPENVTLYENCPVLEADFGSTITLKTAQGSVKAPKAVLAVNGLAARFGFWKGKLLNFAAHASLSRRLTEAEQAALGNIAPWGSTPANAFAGITMRYTNDHRILIRQNIHFCPGLRQSDERRLKIRAEHQRLFDHRFPMLQGVTMEHTWTGYICLSRNGAPGFGQVAPNVWSAVCQNAVGVAKGTISGRLAAEMALGEDDPLISDMISLGTPTPVPPRPFLDIGVRARFAYEIFKNKHEA
ncbi:glycine/D-amino acid oxidase-like deaminating enzyme [Mycoplana sp. BE70]|uniref:NAD(P)/FAD-dependent oxidoreductase n=1 Tax=Mycoplana sp. BE70 TaxID=2817775 RepID=UPI0028596A52|nr:FAD-binding oxidoreductase [Mycoplana sp. BE70]MDR6758028.1 glycine/D-amino acid oxidase-like deaminating enzyme [Mycoplana sp. BE70]